MVAYFLIITTNDIDQETTLAINEQISKKTFRDMKAMGHRRSRLFSTEPHSAEKERVGPGEYITPRTLIDKQSVQIALHKLQMDKGYDIKTHLLGLYLGYVGI